MPESVREAVGAWDDFGDEPASPADLPDGWHFVGRTASAISAELAREISPEHELFGQRVSVIARRLDRDDVLLLFNDTRRVAVVHLTWSGRAEVPPWPITLTFSSWIAWQTHVGDRDAED